MLAPMLRPISVRRRPVAFELPDSGRTIRTPADMVELLRRSCPQDAHDFALRTHERVCEGHDEERTEFWREVVALLASN